MSKNKIIEKIETEQMRLPEFGPGDTVVVQVKIGERRSRTTAGL